MTGITKKDKDNMQPEAIKAIREQIKKLQESIDSTQDHLDELEEMIDELSIDTNSEPKTDNDMIKDILEKLKKLEEDSKAEKIKPGDYPWDKKPYQPFGPYGPYKWDPYTAPKPRCGKCGIELSGTMGYYCTQVNCPTGLGGPISFLMNTATSLISDVLKDELVKKWVPENKNEKKS